MKSHHLSIIFTNFVRCIESNNMRLIILTLLLGSYTLAFAQNKIKGEWCLYELFGKKTSMDMYRLERQTKEKRGYKINFIENKIFIASSFTSSKDDCSPSTLGVYEKINRHYVSFHVHSFSVSGIGCQMNYEGIHADLGKFYIHFPSKGVLYLIKSTGDLDYDKQLAQDAEQINDINSIAKYVFKRNGENISYNPSFKEEVATYVAQVLKLPHYRVCLKFSVGRYTGDVGLVKDLETGTYFYVVKDNTAQQETTQKENKYFHFTSEELNSE